MSDAEPAAIGHNNPPPGPTPFDIIEREIADVYDNATAFLDGKAIDNPALADDISNLLSMFRAADKKAKALRDEEEEEHDLAKKAIRARYAPLIGKTGKTVLGMEACKAALAPWLAAEKARQDAEAAALRAEADRQRAEAEAALRASATDLPAREAAEETLQSAKEADRAANVAEHATATAGGLVGRAVGLRSVWRATISNETDALRSMWADPAGRVALTDLALDWANRKVCTERARSIPGFHIGEETTVV